MLIKHNACISVQKKEHESGMTNSRLLYGGSPKFGFTISDTDFQNVAPDKKDILVFLVNSKKLDFFQSWEKFRFCNVCNGMSD